MVSNSADMIKELENNIFEYEKSIEDYFINETSEQNEQALEQLNQKLGEIELTINDFLKCLKGNSKYIYYFLKFHKTKLAFMKSSNDVEQISEQERLINELEIDYDYVQVDTIGQELNNAEDENEIHVSDDSHEKIQSRRSIKKSSNQKNNKGSYQDLIQKLTDLKVFENPDELSKFKSDFFEFVKYEDLNIKDFRNFLILKDLKAKLSLILDNKIMIAILRKELVDSIKNKDEREIEKENILKSEEVINETMEIIDVLMTNYYKVFISYATHASDLYSILFADVLENDPSEIEKRLKRLKLTFHPDKTGISSEISKEFYILILNCKNHEQMISDNNLQVNELDDYEKIAIQNYEIARAYGNFIRNGKLQSTDLQYVNLDELKSYEADKLILFYHAYLLKAFKYYQSACKIADQNQILDKKLSIRKAMCLCLYLADKLIESQLISISIFFLMDNEQGYNEEQRNDADIFLKSLSEKIKNKYTKLVDNLNKNTEPFNSNVRTSSSAISERENNQRENVCIHLQPLTTMNELALNLPNCLSPRQKKEQKQKLSESVGKVAMLLINSRSLSLDKQKQNMDQSKDLHLSQTKFDVVKAVGYGAGLGGGAITSAYTELVTISNSGLAFGVGISTIASFAVAGFLAYRGYTKFQESKEKSNCCTKLGNILEEAVKLYIENKYLELLIQISKPYSEKDKTKSLITAIYENGSIIDFKIDGEEIISALINLDATSDCIVSILNLIATVLISGLIKITQMPFKKLQSKADDIFKTITRSKTLMNRAKELDKKMSDWVKGILKNTFSKGSKSHSCPFDEEKGKYHKNSYQARLNEMILAAKVNLTILSLTMDYSPEGVEAAKSHLLELNILISNTEYSLSEEVLLRQELLQDFFFIITGEQLPDVKKDSEESSFKVDIDDVDPFTISKTQADVYFAEKFRNAKGRENMLNLIKKKANFYLKIANKSDKNSLERLIDYKKALKEFQIFYDWDKSDVSVCVAILICYYNMNLFNSGLNFVKILLGSNNYEKFNFNESPKLWLYVAMIYRKVNLLPEASVAIDQSLRLKETLETKSEDKIIKNLMLKPTNKVEFYKKSQLNVTKREKSRIFKIISIDGGGIRGIIPTMMLCEIERRAGVPLGDMVDLFAGTSTGAIIAAGLSLPVRTDATKPLFYASDLLELYTTKSKEIFGTPRNRTIFSTNYFKYNNDGRANLLQQTMLNYKMSDSRNNLIITAVKDDFMTLEQFSTYEHPSLQVYDAIMASTSAPTFFQAYHFDEFSYLDGGILANNPSRLAFEHAINKHKISRDNIYVLSLGTGDYLDCKLLDMEKSRSLLYWAKEFANITIDGQTRDTHRWMRENLDSRYHRWQLFMEKPIALDDCNSISQLIDLSDQFIEENDDQINQIVKLFKNN